MLFFPFPPGGPYEGIRLKPRTLEWSGNRRCRRLLPAAARFPILEDFVPADEPLHTLRIEMEDLPLRFRPEHKARVADPAPCDGDRAVRHLVVYDTVLAKVGRQVSLRDTAGRDSNQHITVGNECGHRSRNKIRMIDGSMRHFPRSCILSKGWTGAVNASQSRDDQDVSNESCPHDCPLAEFLAARNSTIARIVDK